MHFSRLSSTRSEAKYVNMSFRTTTCFDILRLLDDNPLKIINFIWIKSDCEEYNINRSQAHISSNLSSFILLVPLSSFRLKPSESFDYFVALHESINTYLFLTTSWKYVLLLLFLYYYFLNRLLPSRRGLFANCNRWRPDH